MRTTILRARLSMCVILLGAASGALRGGGADGGERFAARAARGAGAEPERGGAGYRRGRAGGGGRRERQPHPHGGGAHHFGGAVGRPGLGYPRLRRGAHTRPRSPPGNPGQDPRAGDQAAAHLHRCEPGRRLNLITVLF
eukprot:9492222-Pyramimonas_sp.AAC.1